MDGGSGGDRDRGGGPVALPIIIKLVCPHDRSGSVIGKVRVTLGYVVSPYLLQGRLVCLGPPASWGYEGAVPLHTLPHFGFHRVAT